MLDFQLGTVLDRLGAGAGASCRVDEQRRRGRLAEPQPARQVLDWGSSPDRVHTLRLGIDHEFFEPTPGGPATTCHVLAVGKDLARDYETLAQAAERTDAPFYIVTAERNLRGIALPTNIEVKRNLPYGELRRLYARARCIALPVRRPDYP